MNVCISNEYDFVLQTLPSKSVASESIDICIYICFKYVLFIAEWTLLIPLVPYWCIWTAILILLFYFLSFFDFFFTLKKTCARFNAYFMHIYILLLLTLSLNWVLDNTCYNFVMNFSIAGALCCCVFGFLEEKYTCTLKLLVYELGHDTIALPYIFGNREQIKRNQKGNNKK